jgi:hypothetical protein
LLFEGGNEGVAQGAVGVICQRCPNLVGLAITKNRVKPVDIQAIASLTKLREIALIPTVTLPHSRVREE